MRVSALDQLVFFKIEQLGDFFRGVEQLGWALHTTVHRADEGRETSLGA